MQLCLIASPVETDTRPDQHYQVSVPNGASHGGSLAGALEPHPTYRVANGTALLQVGDGPHRLSAFIQSQGNYATLRSIAPAIIVAGQSVTVQLAPEEVAAAVARLQQQRGDAKRK